MVPDMKTRFSHTVIHVGNVVHSVEWYEHVFGLVRKYLAPDGSYAEMDTGGVILALSSNQLARKTYPTFQRNSLLEEPCGAHLCFTSDDVALLYKFALSQGAVPVQGPTIKPWGQEEAWIRDLNGVLVAIMSSPKLNSTPPPNPPALPD
jgi:catechol 2,3-dioxygenase-like lactoylglutathione lyase family enzyme